VSQLSAPLPVRTSSDAALPSRSAAVAAYAIFFVSGFAALVDQVAWQRMLGLLAGTDALATTVVVAAFMAGLGFGSLAGGAWADRLGARGALRAFALVETAVAVCAFAGPPLFPLLARSALVAKAGASIASLAPVALALLLLPTFMMGATLPLLARAVTRDCEGAARSIGALYAVNAGGAALGAWTATWVLVRSYGLSGTLYLSGAANLASACAALLVARAALRRCEPGAEPSAAAPDAARRTPPTEGFGYPLLLTLSAAAGFFALAWEMLWFRLLGVVLKSTAFTFGTLLGFYLGGLALGAYLGSICVRRSRSPARTFCRLELGAALYAGATLVFFCAVLGRYTGFEDLWAYLGSYEPLMRKGDPPQTATVIVHATGLSPAFSLLYLLVPAVVILPPAMLFGAAFPFLQRAAQVDPERIGRRTGALQGASIVGSIAGTSIAGWYLLDVLGTAASARVLVAGGALFAGAALLAARPRRWSGRLVGGALVAVPLLLSALMPSASELWATAHGAPAAEIVFAEDKSGVGLIKVETKDGLLEASVYANGIGQSWIPYRGIHTVLGALPILLHPRPERVAMIGLGSADTLFHLAGREAVREIVCIEIVEPMRVTLSAFAARERYEPLAAILRDPRVRFIGGDGRAYLRRSTELFDVIEADALRANSAYAGNLSSKEYFELVLSRLAPGGLATAWMPTRRTHSTFCSVFPHVLSFGEIALGSNAPIPYEPDVVKARLAEPFTQRHFAASKYSAQLEVSQFLSLRGATILTQEYDRSKLVDLNRDLWPRDEFELPERR
jgi:spermidine synthase